MKKIITTILVLTVLVLSLSFAVSACPSCFDPIFMDTEGLVDGLMPEMPAVGDEGQAQPEVDDSTDASTTADTNQTTDTNDGGGAGEWIVMIVTIIALAIMTGGIVYMVSKNWDGKKSDEE